MIICCADKQVNKMWHFIKIIIFNSSLDLWMVEPNPAAGQSVVLLFNIFGQLVLRQLLQQPSDTMALELGSPRVPDQDLGTVGSDTVV